MASITLRQLDYFIATADSGQVSHAAVELNISQSAVTAAIKSLEIELASGCSSAPIRAFGSRWKARAFWSAPAPSRAPSRRRFKVRCATGRAMPGVCASA